LVALASKALDGALRVLAGLFEAPHAFERAAEIGVGRVDDELQSVTRGGIEDIEEPTGGLVVITDERARERGVGSMKERMTLVADLLEIRRRGVEVADLRLEVSSGVGEKRPKGVQ
jgi:hypothetical protein